MHTSGSRAILKKCDKSDCSSKLKVGGSSIIIGG